MEGNINPTDLGLATQLQMAAVLLASGTPEQKKMIEEFLSNLFKTERAPEAMNHPTYKMNIRLGEETGAHSYSIWGGNTPSPEQVIEVAKMLAEQSDELISGLPQEHQLQARRIVEDRWPRLDLGTVVPEFVMRVRFHPEGGLLHSHHGWRGHPSPAQRAQTITILEQAIEFWYDMFPKNQEDLEHLATHQHYKGGLYRYRFDFKHSETGETMVAYRHLWPHEPGNWGRPKEMFYGNLEDGRVRFQPIVKE
jgi:hypothetical protein